MKRRVGPAAAGDHENAILVGRLLRDRRQRDGLTPEQVGLAIRVNARHVLAVEEGRFTDLPPQPYVRGLISSYATLLGLDPDELLRACAPALAGEGSGRPARIFRYPLRERFVWREWIVPISLAAVVAAILVARAAFPPAPVALDVTPPLPLPLPPPAAVRPAALAEEPAPSGQPTDAPGAAPGVQLVLRSEGTTWTEAVPDGGELRRYELGPGENLTITAREKLSLSLGDAGVVRLRINERELGFIGYKGEPKSGLWFFAAKLPPITAAPRGGAGD